jgi:hypothetical protein
MPLDLPLDYDKLNAKTKKLVRDQYIKEQDGKCYYCKHDLDKNPPKEVTDLKINWKLFPPGMLRNPVHLQHDHYTGMTEGAVHAYCNCVMWQYIGK